MKNSQKSSKKTLSKDLGVNKDDKNTEKTNSTYREWKRYNEIYSSASKNGEDKRDKRH